VGLLIACLSLAVLLSTFWAFKKVLPVFSPFVWDPSMMRLDRAVHFGTDPWALLQPILGQPAITLLLDRLYYLWFISTLSVGYFWGPYWPTGSRPLVHATTVSSKPVPIRSPR
jgi:hypothetical protein